MAGRGPAPKDTASRARDQRRRHVVGMVAIAPDDEIRGPELPETFDWPDATRDWWELWRKSPQAQTFTETDWSFLLDTALLHMAFWDGDRSAAPELRLRVAKFGATPEDRARLKIAVGSPGVVSPVRAPRTKATTQRKGRLLKAVGDDHA